MPAFGSQLPTVINAMVTSNYSLHGFNRMLKKAAKLINIPHLGISSTSSQFVKLYNSWGEDLEEQQPRT